MSKKVAFNLVKSPLIPGVQFIYTPFSGPPIRPLVQKHVEAGAIFIHLVDENDVPVFPQDNPQFFVALDNMQKWGCSRTQCALVVVGENSSTSHLLAAWQALGGTAFAIETEKKLTSVLQTLIEASDRRRDLLTSLPYISYHTVNAEIEALGHTSSPYQYAFVLQVMAAAVTDNEENPFGLNGTQIIDFRDLTGIPDSMNLFVYNSDKDEDNE